MLTVALVLAISGALRAPAPYIAPCIMAVRTRREDLPAVVSALARIGTKDKTDKTRSL
jgi:hypothetical protein